MSTADTFIIKKGDLEPPITATLKDAAGAVVDLTGATAVTLVLAGGTRLSSTILDAVNGRVRHTWSGAETAVAAVKAAEWEVTWPSARPQTFPTTGTFTVTIEADQG